MKVRRLKIHNFRSIKDLDLKVPDMLVLLGPNNHGKSNVLSALEFALSTSAKVQPDDLFMFRENGDNELWVEVTFEQLTEQESTTFARYLRTDGSVKIRKTARLRENGAADLAYNGYLEQAAEWWLQAGAQERLGSREQVEREAEAAPPLTALLEGGGRITRQRVQDFQDRYIQAHRDELTFSESLEEGPLLGQKNVAGGVLPEFFLVPAVRDLSEEVKIRSSTTFGRLLQRAVREMAERDARLIDLRDRMRGLIDDLNARPDVPPERASELARLELSISRELQSWGVTASIEVTPPEIEKVFELGTSLHLDDGIRTLAERKGHGLQRAVLFALLRSWARALRAVNANEGTTARQSSDSVYFAMEEPELFLHPHAQRQLYAALVDLARAADHQVFICTHSTHFVDLERYRNIAVITKRTPQVGTTACQCSVDLFEGEDARERRHRFHMASWVNPDRGEIFFARKVILVEGETEQATIPFLATKLGCFDAGISVIDCGGKQNLPLYIKVLNAFSIPYCVVHDEDPVPDPIPTEWSAEKTASKRATFEVNQTIRDATLAGLGHVEVMAPHFEGICGISSAQAERKGKAIAALDHFDGMEPGALPERVAEIVRAGYGAVPEAERVA